MSLDALKHRHGQSLKKYEILRGSKPVSKLFSSARSVRGQFIKVLFAPLELDGFEQVQLSLPQVLFVVGKKNISDAVSRNRIKRLMKEAYRHEKTAAIKCAGKHTGGGNQVLGMAFMYIGRETVKPSPERFRKEIRSLLEGVVRMSPG